MAHRRSWVTAYSPCDHGVDADRDPELTALQAALSRDPSISKVWLGPEWSGGSCWPALPSRPSCGRL